MIVMDRENLWARGWSHVLSTTNDLEELREFAARVGAPPSALHLGNPEVAAPGFEAAAPGAGPGSPGGQGLRANLGDAALSEGTVTGITLLG